MNKWQAIVFDMDDTLYPERSYVLSGFQAVAQWAEATANIPAQQGFMELQHLFEQGVRGDTFNRWLQAHDVDPEGYIPQLVQVYRNHQPRLQPFRAIPALLKSLYKNHRLGLVSDGYLAVQQRKFAALGLEHYFHAVVFSDQWGRQAWKPSVKPFQVVLQQLAVDAAESVYIGDNPTKDFSGAHQIGMSTIWLRQNGSEYAQREPPTAEHAPDLVVTSLAKLQSAVM